MYLYGEEKKKRALYLTVFFPLHRPLPLLFDFIS